MCLPFEKFGQSCKPWYSNIISWVGLHAISQNWKIAGIDFVPFEDDLLLFILMFFVTGVNATVATRFSSERNWFSDGFEALGSW